MIKKFIIWLVGLFKRKPTYKLDNKEALNAFAWLNKVRKEPYLLDWLVPNLSEAPILKWNDILAKVAQDKAIDMVKHQYYGHIDSEGYGINNRIFEAGYKINTALVYNDLAANNFESLAANSGDGRSSIDVLIKSTSHRKHIMAETSFFRKCTDCGIAYVKMKNSKWKNFIVIIIASKKL